MKIAVCFKIMADYARLSEQDWHWDAHHHVDTGFVRRMFNCYDESALEMALAFAGKGDDLSPSTKLTALTVEDERGDLFLRHLLAVGYHHAVRIPCSPMGSLDFNPLAISRLISACIKREGHELVILGTQGGDGDNGQTGFFVAEIMEWPCIAGVIRMERTEYDHTIQVTSPHHGATVIQTVQLPVVLIMGNAPDSPSLRVPTLKQKLNAKKRAIPLVSAVELGLDHEPSMMNNRVLVHLQRPRSKHTCVFLDGNTPREQAQQLFDQYLKERIPL